MLSADDFTPFFQDAIPVRLAARCFIIPVPAGIGALMTYPFDVPDCADMKKGMPLLDSHGNPKGVGLVFFNPTDQAVQGVRANGQETIIVNGLSPDQANALAAYARASLPDPARATAEAIYDLLCYARDVLGADDFFNDKRAKIPAFEAEALVLDNEAYGVFVRRNGEKRLALLGLGSGTFAGPAGSPQRFNGNVVVVGNDRHKWLVQTSAFLNTYRHPDDHPLRLTDLPVVQIRDGLTPCPASHLVPKGL
jgi:hypothetical protein